MEATKCQRCEAERVLTISAKTSDKLTLEINGREYRGYTPDNDILTDSDYSPGYGDYLVLHICLNCGQAQGAFPAEKIEECE